MSNLFQQKEPKKQTGPRGKPVRSQKRGASGDRSTPTYRRFRFHWRVKLSLPGSFLGSFGPYQSGKHQHSAKNAHGVGDNIFKFTGSSRNEDLVYFLGKRVQNAECQGGQKARKSLPCRSFFFRKVRQKEKEQRPSAMNSKQCPALRTRLPNSFFCVFCSPGESWS